MHFKPNETYSQQSRMLPAITTPIHTIHFVYDKVYLILLLHLHLLLSISCEKKLPFCSIEPVCDIAHNWDS